MLHRTVQVAVCPLESVAVIVQRPLPTRVTVPLASTVAMLVSLELQVMSPEPPVACRRTGLGYWLLMVMSELLSLSGETGADGSGEVDGSVDGSVTGSVDGSVDGSTGGSTGGGVGSADGSTGGVGSGDVLTEGEGLAALLLMVEITLQV